MISFAEAPPPPRDTLDRLRIGRIEDGRRYMGNGCWEVVTK